MIRRIICAITGHRFAERRGTMGIACPIGDNAWHYKWATYCSRCGFSYG